MDFNRINKRWVNVPMYRYICPNCGNEEVVLKSADDKTIPVCEKCNSEMERAVATSVSVKFKGSGFYSTDK